MQRSAPDIKTEFFELLHQLLLNNWRYFFRPNVQNRVTHGDDGTCENQGQFVKMMEVVDNQYSSANQYETLSILIDTSLSKINILLLFSSQAFGQSFTQTDITVFKQNLQSLEDLNSKRKLYQKVRFCVIS